MPSPIPYPPCCVVFVYAGDGESLAQAARSSEWTHVHALAGRGISGVLLLKDAGQHTVLTCESLVTQFLGTEAAEGDIAARFKNLRPVCLADSASVCATAAGSGCLIQRLAAGTAPQDAAALASRNLAKGAPAVFLAVTDPAAAGEGAVPASAWSAALAWVQAFLEAGALEGTLLTIVFAVEAPLPAPLACRVAEAGGAQPMLAPAGPDFPPLPRPWQSFQASGPTGLVDVSRACVGLTLQHLPGVTRCDLMESFQPEAICQKGGAGMILAESLLAELAFKIGHAPKYGA
ncbi:hypothetical protein ACKKBG_A31290 [Auxenochlorella protothecoides x Auxenochlorella symbiontica]|uniref:Uncharacterized protein n=1 Tax=Auxenochlorella protothecoides TaxID=3075 RepID=A0A1D2AH76_AUXPR|nr:hypothetical protein APUTEX25_004880 [Auxenochlorella protothecoides]|eukprot:RMZ53392.1 hypothetical protein APUTEX25_004880 [Auxenochlorella protothecoides]